jgi:hypothetical protein
LRPPSAAALSTNCGVSVPNCWSPAANLGSTSRRCSRATSSTTAASTIVRSSTGATTTATTSAGKHAG